jgi:O-antigen ligase
VTIAIPRSVAGGRRTPPILLHPHPQAPPARQAPAVVRTRSDVNVLVRLAFYLFVFSIPFEMPNRSIPIEIPTLTGAIFLLTTLFQPSKSYRHIPGAFLWFVVYFWIFGLSTVVNRTDHTGLVITQFLNLLQVAIILWTASNLLRDRTMLRGTLLTLALAVTVQAGMQILGIATTATALWTGGARMTVFGQNANISAIILSAGFITVLNLRPRIIAWPFAAMIAYAMIQTGSRGGLMCAVVGLGVLLWQGRTAWARIRAILVGLLMLAGLAFAVWRSDMLRVRFLAGVEEGSLAGRERIYPATLSMISEKPILGWGPTENQFEIGKRIGEEKKERRDAHNIVLELLSATGILGAIPFLIGLAFCVASAWRARRGAFHMLPIALLATCLTGSISGTWQSSKVLWLAMSIALATGAVVRDTERRRCAV